MQSTDSIKHIVAFVTESEDDDMKDVSGIPDKLGGVHDDVLSALIDMGISADRIHFHESDVYVMCPTYEEALRVKKAGAWNSMATVERTNPDHPDAKQFPWLADLPFANLAGAMKKRLRQDFPP